MTSCAASITAPASSARSRSTLAAEAPIDARRVGLISDTHGLLRDSALQALRGCDLILHAGDIGSPAVLDGLSRIAPVIAVRGNNDTDAWALDHPEQQRLSHRVSGLHLLLLHDLKTLRDTPSTSGAHIIVSGHTHRPKIEVREGVLYINPGSAGPRRFTLPICIAQLTFGTGMPQAELVTLS